MRQHRSVGLMIADPTSQPPELTTAEIPLPPTAENLPAVVPPPRKPSTSRNLRRVLSLLVLLALAGAAGYWHWLRSQPSLPPGFATGNGRLEADEVDIDTKFAGRILKLNVDEGDLVKAGQVVAVMDTRDLEAQLKQSQQLVAQAQHTLEQAEASKVSQQAVVKLAQQELARTTDLVPRGFATVELRDQQTQQLNSAIATLNADEAAIAAAQHALGAATHQVEYYAVQIADNQLFAPKDGPIEYRVANVGEVLAAGGKVFTMLDASYVYMDIYLPTEQAGRVRIGSEARIVLDAYPGHVIPARVVFVASQAQFTPKTVETKEERDKLMFRIRIRIDPERLEGREAMMRTGLPGVGYVRTEPSAVWPQSLAPSPPPPAQ
ncbi:MAG TPA: HlyD family efflux transporter periplasmic adaptor subunit [Rhodopila sp.]|uniref:HlyD family secretion protein n=1 Tax=Rhodopila sp. TaxID=2480087 RepID=UPI002C2CFB6B|nr:HlyD family efflux transporter periplasmic adaptor subunit [Rhodopila sp.]HVY15353.1 HlyD family efflux transporter periplasmic adaptor subunit [Rhodopila sp.]